MLHKCPWSSSLETFSFFKSNRTVWLRGQDSGIRLPEFKFQFHVSLNILVSLSLLKKKGGGLIVVPTSQGCRTLSAWHIERTLAMFVKLSDRVATECV